MTSEDRGQTAVIGSLITVTLVVVFVVSVGAWIVTGIDSGSEPLFAAGVTATSQNVTITHAGGDEFNATDLTVVVRDGANDTARFPLASGSIEGDPDPLFEPGEAVTHAHGSNGGAITVLIIHVPTNALLADESVDFGSSGGGGGAPASNSAPTASFTYSPSGPNTGESIGFDASDSSDADGPIVTYRWDWSNDGTYDDTGQTVNHSYADDGTYTVKLRVVDDHGAADTATETVTVSSRPPIANFTYAPSSPKTNEPAEFDASKSSDPDGSVVTYEWDWTGDGTYDDTGQTVNHSYADDGTYTVELRITDDTGATNTTTETVTVSNRPPTANFTYAPTNASTGESIDFDASNSSDADGYIASYEWDWTNDGTYDDTGQTVNHTYPDNGTYTVRLRVTDDDGSTNTTTATVTVSAGPAPADTTPPTVLKFEELTADKDSNEITVGELEVKDTGSGLDTVEIEVRRKGESEVIGSESLAVSDGTEEANWTDVVVSTSGIQPNKEYEVTVIVTDVDGNTRTETRTVETEPGGGGGGGGGGPPPWAGP